RFGNRSANALLATQLALTLPSGVTVVDAGGGTASGHTITWALGTLNATMTGSRQVSVHVDDLGADDPAVRVARGVVTSGTVTATTSVVTEVQASAFRLAVTATPDPVAPAGLVTYQLTVANDGVADAVQVELRMTLPVGVFSCGTISDSGQTPESCL